jgi:hypothetical protein
MTMKHTISKSRPSNRGLCKGTTAEGKPCQQWKAEGSQYCRHHKKQGDE